MDSNNHSAPKMEVKQTEEWGLGKCLQWLDAFSGSFGGNVADCSPNDTPATMPPLRKNSFCCWTWSTTTALLNRGVEKEVQRVVEVPKGKSGDQHDSSSAVKGMLAQTAHPAKMGSPLTHPLITLDYCESQVEFVTPVCQSPKEVIDKLNEMQIWATTELPKEEFWWPGSMPPPTEKETDVPLANFGTSHQAIFKNVYRRGLAVRYGRGIQAISGIHVNMSPAVGIWPCLCKWTWLTAGDKCYDNLHGPNLAAAAEAIDRSILIRFRSEKLMAALRNVQRDCWLPVFLFGATPAVHSSFPAKDLALESMPEDGEGETRFLPWATSLRVSDVGYTSEVQASLDISYNSLNDLLDGICDALKKPHALYEKSVFTTPEATGEEAERQQLNSNALQIENEHYAAVRAKRSPQDDERPLQALVRRGVEYLELRFVDTNPLLEAGIDEEQLKFLDIWFLHLILTPVKYSPAMDTLDRRLCKERLYRVAKFGRKPGLTLPYRTSMCSQSGEEFPTQTEASSCPVSTRPKAADETEEPKTVDGTDHPTAGGETCEVDMKTQAKRLLTQLFSVAKWLDCQGKGRMASCTTSCSPSPCESGNTDEGRSRLSETPTYFEVVQRQLAKLDDTSLTPSAQVLDGIRQAGGFMSFHMKMAKIHTESFRQKQVPVEVDAWYKNSVIESQARQTNLEEADKAEGLTFEEFLANLKRQPPVTPVVLDEGEMDDEGPIDILTSRRKWSCGHH